MKYKKSLVMVTVFGVFFLVCYADYNDSNKQSYMGKMRHVTRAENDSYAKDKQKKEKLDLKHKQDKQKIENKYAKKNIDREYERKNEAAKIKPGSDGLYILPFGNGAERILNNKIIGSHIHNIDLNKHTAAHLYRAGQEGIAFAFRYGLDIMRENGMHPSIIRAGKANMFLSNVFAEAFVNATNVPVELYNCDGSVGAALGAGIGANIFSNAKDAFANMKPLQLIEPTHAKLYDDLYKGWKECLNRDLEGLK